MSGPDKYRRFAMIVPNQEDELYAKRALAAQRVKGAEDDLKKAREELKPEGRKKKAAAKKTTARRKTAKQKAVEKEIEKNLGTREEQVARLPNKGGSDNGQ